MSENNDIDYTSTDDPPRGSRRVNPMDVHVGTRVRLRRMLIGMSQETLGDQLEVTFQQVQNYEKGANRIGASRLFAVSRVLDVPVQFFYDEAPAGRYGPTELMAGFADAPGESYVVEFLGSRDGLELNKAFARIKDPKVRRSIIDLARSLAGEEENQ